ncbi:uncharacterized protein LOC131225451 [Magnolia sinica]|uniref:uncharacterized protein LOC131225451 n=1 Tax=Magnolia sinica TaxID=86752 RepID=UPI002657DC29|nr:uncharacterized protein LOC131225451 [Magnolia sinica]
MASSLALGCGKVFLNADKEAPRFSRLQLHNRRYMMRSTCFNENENLQGRGGNMTSRLSIYAPDSCKLREKKMSFHEDPNPVSLDKLDEWMRESVTEIVRNIGEAPFLVHVYSNKGDGSSSTTTRLERQLAMSEKWPYITRRWKERSCPTPDGVILVEELKDDEDGGVMNCSVGSQCSRAWGIVIQGRGLDCAACYILKTSRICSSVGFCTHFCLVRAKCFGETTELQLRDCWLKKQ